MPEPTLSPAAPAPIVATQATNKDIPNQPSNQKLFLFQHKSGKSRFEGFLVRAGDEQEATDMIAKAVEGDQVIDYDVFPIKPLGESKILLTFVK